MLDKPFTHKGLGNLNQELLKKTLASLGLTQIDAEIYILLCREGPQNGRSIANALNLYRRQLSRSLRHLQGKGMVSSTFEHPAHFSAVSLEKILDFLIKVKKEQALALKESKEELLSTWKAFAKGTADS